MTEPRRALLISVHGDPMARLGSVQAGGQNVYVRELALALARRGWAVDVATHRASPRAPVAEAPAPGMRVLRYDAGRPEFVPKDQLPELIPAFFQQVAEHLRQPPQVIHSNYWISGQVGLLLREWWQVPQVHTFHSLGKVRIQALGADQRRDTQARIRAEQRLLEATGAVLASNPMEAALLREHYRVPPGRLRIVPCGVNPAVFHPRPQAAARATLGLPEAVLPVVFAGRFEHNKGLAVLLRALAALVQGHEGLRACTELFVAGGNPAGAGLGPEEARVRSLVAELGLQDHVNFLGPLDQAALAVWFAAAEVTVVPSFYETFGLVALEAMACGSPVIASRTGGLAHTVRHGETGLLVPPGDVPALAAALEQVLGRPGVAARLREPLRRGLPAEFTWDHIAAKAEAVYQEVAGETYAPLTASGD